MKILVTGHRGFIGSHLVPALAHAGHEVFGYDLDDGFDIRDKRQLEFYFETENFDAVIHMAALAGVRRGELYPEDYLSTNVIGTKNIVDLSEKYGVKLLINFSSSSVYGGRATENRMSEIWPTIPVSIYGMSKLMAEQIVDRSKIETVNIRPFTVYGPQGRKDQVMMRWIDAIKSGRTVPVYSNNQQDAKRVLRGYTHVNDLIKGIRFILEQRSDPNKLRMQHTTYNLGGSDGITLWLLLEIFGKVKQFKYQYMGRQPGDVLRSFADTTKANRELGWTPTMDFAKEVKKIVREGLRS